MAEEQAVNQEVTQEKEDAQQDSFDYESAAKEMGWRPKEDFQGDPGKWTDAKSFYEKGVHVLPIVKSQLSDVKAKNAKLEAELKLAREDTLRMKDFMEKQAAAELRALNAQIDELKKSKAKAIEEADGAKVLEIEGKIEDAKEARAALKQEKNDAKEVAAKLDPAFEAFVAANKWYGANNEMTGWANSLGHELDAQGKTLPQILNIIVERAKEKFPEHFGIDTSTNRPGPQRGGKVEGKMGANTYEAMPTDAKAACDRFVKLYKISKDEYVKQYWSEQ